MSDEGRLAQADTVIAAYGDYLQAADVLLREDVDPGRLYADHPRAYEAVRHALTITHGAVELADVPGLEAWDLVAGQIGTYILTARKLASDGYAFADPTGDDARLLVDYSAAQVS